VKPDVVLGVVGQFPFEEASGWPVAGEVGQRVVAERSVLVVHSGCGGKSSDDDAGWRGIPTDVSCVVADQRVCLRHRRWLGGFTDPATDQHDLTALPEIVAAQRRHYRLIRRLGAEAGRNAIYSATHIIDRWRDQEQLVERQRNRIDARLNSLGTSAADRHAYAALVNYQAVVTLATVLAEPRWTAIASADHRADRLLFEREVADRLGLPPIGSTAGDPLVSWEEGQALVRRQRLHRNLHYRGPEVWLSGLTALSAAWPGRLVP
jgi:hypothetical protein